MAMKWREIMKNTPKDRKSLAELVKIIKMKRGRDKQGFAVAMAETMSLVSPSGEVIKPKNRVKYLTTVTFVDSELHVRVSCSCHDFLYRWEVPLNKKGAAAIEYSNGEPTRVTNPSSVPGQCVAKGTLVQTKSGDKPIEDVQVGDEVQTLRGFARVTDAGLTGEQRATLRFTTIEGKLEVTPDHLVYAWKSGDIQPYWVAASQLKIGDNLILLLKYEPVWLAAIDHIEDGMADVYDLTVADEHHFTANGFVVHNCKHLVAFYNKLKPQYPKI